FIEDPHTVVKTGDIVKVKVLEVDLARKRIALTMRLDEVAGDSDKKQSSSNNTNSARNNKGQKPTRNNRQSINNGNNAGNSAMGDALAAAFGKKR
ncbi:S1 RNA-binding domain-containing protein, partial [Escherichia coli]|nr:S1 RNA-binding domain-containing protein [Escherichia coli]